MTAHIAYTSPNKTKIVWIEMELSFFLSIHDMPQVYVHAWTLCCFHSVSSTQIFWRALAAAVDNCTEIQSASSVG